MGVIPDDDDLMAGLAPSKDDKATALPAEAAGLQPETSFADLLPSDDDGPPSQDSVVGDESAPPEAEVEVSGSAVEASFADVMPEPHGEEEPEEPEVAVAEPEAAPAEAAPAEPARELTSHELLVVDQDESVGRGLGELLAADGLHVTWAGTPQRAMDLLVTKYFGVVIVDLDTPGPDQGLETIRRIHREAPTANLIALVPRRSFDAAVAAFRAGARDVVPKSPDEVRYLRTRILEAAADVKQNNASKVLHGDLREFLDEFLRRFMDSERRVQELEDRISGRDASLTDDRSGVRVLMIDSDARVFDALAGLKLKGFSFVHCGSGGDGLDRSTSDTFQLAIVGPVLPDLPTSMVVKTLKAQNPELLVITYEPRGPLTLIETTRTITLVAQFTAINQLSDRLTELAQAHRGKARERRYLMSFRERHYETLRTLQALRKRLE